MRRSRIFTDKALAESASVELDARNNHYLMHVLRVKQGQALQLFNGSGREFNAHIAVSYTHLTLPTNREV